MHLLAIAARIDHDADRLGHSGIEVGDVPEDFEPSWV